MSQALSASPPMTKICLAAATDYTSESYDIPDEQRYYNSKSYGWEMCFCKFNDNSSESSYDSIKTPMYHALNYGFPVNHTIGGGKNWATSTDSTKQMVTIRPLSRNTSTMTLTGELMGNVQGSETTYWTEMQTSSSNPSFSSFYNYWSTMSNSITSSSMGLMMVAGASSGAGIGIAVDSAVLSLVTGIMGCINQSYMETEEVEDSYLRRPMKTATSARA